MDGNKTSVQQITRNIMISIYSVFTNKNFSTNTIANLTSFASEVCIGCSDQQLYEKLNKNITKYTNLQIIKIDSNSITNMYNEVLKHTTHPVKLCLLENEYVDTKYKKLWFDLSHLLLQDSVDAYAIPLVDKNLNTIEFKWFLHKQDCIRGVVNCSIPEYTKKTDGMDLVYPNSKTIVNFKMTPVDKINLESEKYPFVSRS